MMRKALQIRPHDFLADQVGAWLAELELEPVRLRSLAALAGHRADEVAVLVISAGVTSSVNVPFREAVVAARTAFSRAPVVVTGLAPLKATRAGLEVELQGLGITLVGVTPSGAPLGLTALYVCADDLAAARVAASAALEARLAQPR